MFAEALAGLEMTVTVDGEEYDAKFKPGDMIRFERHTGRAMTALAETTKDGAPSVKLEDLAFLAFAALTRTDRYEGDFDAFIDVLEDIELLGADADPPTQQADSPG